MRASVIINGFTASNFLAEDGISISTVKRNERTIITLDGTLEQTYKEKLSMSLTFMDMPDNYYKQLMDAVRSASPATVVFTNLDTGQTVSKRFYINEHPYTVNKVIGQISYLNSITLDLEEK